jgi:hypothetical protein
MEFALKYRTRNMNCFTVIFHMDLQHFFIPIRPHGGEHPVLNTWHTFAAYCTRVTSEILVDQAYKKFKSQSS